MRAQATALEPRAPCALSLRLLLLYLLLPPFTLPSMQHRHIHARFCPMYALAHKHLISGYEINKVRLPCCLLHVLSAQKDHLSWLASPPQPTRHLRFAGGTISARTAPLSSRHRWRCSPPCRPWISGAHSLHCAHCTALSQPTCCAGALCFDDCYFSRNSIGRPP